MAKKEKAYCVVSLPKLYSTVEEAMSHLEHFGDVKLEQLVVCQAIGTPEPKFKIKKGVYPFGVVKTIPKDTASKPEPLVESPVESVQPEPCTFCSKPAVKTFFDSDKQPFVVCADHIKTASKL